MSPAPAASLHRGLLASKGGAQPSRGIAEPASERIARGMDGGTILRALAATKPPRSTAAASGRVIVRLEERQRLRLRLASAHLGKSRQEILLDAFEHYLSEVVPKFLDAPCSCIGGPGSDAGPCCRDRP